MEKDLQLRRSFGSHYKFPKKLMKVANDGTLIRWTEDNGGLIVQKKDYEESVMEMYPGFVQVGTFDNLRRLFRDYNFKFRITQNKYSNRGLQVEFRHPNFTRDNFHLLSQVKKKPRKTNYSYYKYQRQLKTKTSSSTKYKRKLQNLQNHVKRAYVSTRTHFNLDSYDFENNKESPLSIDNISPYHTPNKQNCGQCHTPGGIYELFSGNEMSPIVRPKRKYKLRLKSEKGIVNCKKQLVQETELQLRPNLHDIDVNHMKLLQVYAKNELAEDEFWELVTRNSNLLCRNMSWEMIKKYIDNAVCHELSPLHFKGYYHELSLSEM